MRLTKRIIEKNTDGYVLNHKEDFTENTYEVIQKLGKLEDLEEQIGCPLEGYVKIQLGLVNIIYVKRYKTVREYWNEHGPQLEQKECLQARRITKVYKRVFYYQDILGEEKVSFSEYGTEFWLKEDKSE